MAIRVAWDTAAKKAVRYTFTGQWNWFQLEQALQESFALTESVPHRVDAILEMTATQCMPSGVLLHGRRAMTYLPENRGMIMVVSQSEPVKVAAEMFKRIFRTLGERIALVESIETARLLLETFQASQQAA